MGQSTFERDRDRRGFKELAKLAGSPPRPKAASISGIRRTELDENDSGMVDLHALASADPGAVDRASVTPLASTPLFDEEPAKAAASSRPAPSRPAPRSSPPPIPPSAQALPAGTLVSPSLPRPIVAPSVPAPRPVVSAQAALAVPAPAPSRRSPLGRIGAVAAFAAIAAGAFFVVRTVRAPHAASAPEAVAVAPRAASETPHSAAAVAPPPAPAADPGVDPLSLPKQAATAPGGHRPARAWHSPRGTQSLVAKADPKEAAEEAPVAKAEPPAAKEPPAAPPPPAANNALLNSMMAAATPAAPAEAAPVPAAATVGAGGGPAGGGVAQRPSQGQVTGALGAVLPEARGCLNDEDGVSRAHVVFGSDGAVQSVQISGFAAGKPVEACIKAALGKAHVPPFAEASYGATATVRP